MKKYNITIRLVAGSRRISCEIQGKRTKSYIFNEEHLHLASSNVLEMVSPMEL